MDSARLRQIEEIYHAALQITPAERDDFFKNACGTDEDLRREVESLLEFEKSSGDFIENAPALLVAEMFAEEEPPASIINRKIGRYTIKKLLGKGGMGEVFLAEDAELGRFAAIKVLTAEVAVNSDRIRRFVQEAKSASALNHPNILTIYEIGESEGLRFMASEYVEGQTLTGYLKQKKPDIKEILKISMQIVSALKAAHEAGIIHRDIKPDNVMIRQDGIVKVLDFGLAKLIEKRGEEIDTEAETFAKVSTTPGMIMGTPNYMSPEQARGRDIDRQTDIFSFGVCIYEMLAGQLPFEGDTTSDIIASILMKEPKSLRDLNLALPPELEKIVSQTLEKEKQNRYQSAKDLLNDLEQIQKRLEFETHFGTPSPNALVSEESATRIFEKRTTAEGAPSKRAIQNVNSVAVLPFVNAGGEPDMNYLSEGISESLINSLSKLPQLKVIARNSSFKYGDAEEAARVLGVKTVVTGRIRRFGDDLQISAEVMNAQDNTQIWGEQYIRHLSNLLQIQLEISREIADSLRLRLTDSEQILLEKAETVSAEAYELLLKGRFYWNKGSTENRHRGIEYFKRAIEADENYALAYAELSGAYRSMVASSLLPPEVFTPKAEQLALKALSLDAHSAEAHLALAWLRRDAWAWHEAEIEFEKAIRLNPNFARAHNAFAYYLSVVGRHDEAVSEIMRVKELDPASPVSFANVATIFYFARRYDEALNSLGEALELDKTYPYLHSDFGYIYLAQGKSGKAAEAFQKALKTGSTSPSTMIFLGASLAKAGNLEQAEEILHDLETSENYVSAGELAILYAALGEIDKAFASLEKAYAENDLQLQYLGNDPAFDDLRDDARFSHLLRRVGLRNADTRETDERFETPNNLSSELSPLIGREAEIEEVLSLIKKNQTRLLTLTGVGGTGKTRLAKAVAQKSLANFADGVFFVDLSAVADSHLLEPAIAQTLYLKKTESLKDFLTERKILLIIDNFEQIIKAASNIGELLADSINLKILITSRVRLNLRFEREFVLEPLEIPTENDIKADKLAAFASVRLFVERARAVKNGFDLTEENAGAIAEICRNLDGLPLAIELAAAQVKLFAPRAIRKRLENNFQILTSGARDLPERQRTMHGAIAWSYDLLEPDEQKLFSRVSIFRGGFSLDSAETVGNADGNLDIFTSLSSLVDKSLLVQREQKDGEPRFKMLQVVRDFARKILENAGEENEIRHLHAAFFVSLGEQAEVEFKGKDAVEWLEKIDLEHDNYRLALEWTLTHEPETALRIAGALPLFWIRRGYLAEGNKWTLAALEKSGDDANPKFRAKALCGLGSLSWNQGNLTEAEQFLQKSLSLSREISDKQLIVHALDGYGIVKMMQGDFPAALTLFEEGFEIATEIDDRYEIARLANCLGEIFRTEKDYENALVFYEKSLTLARRESFKHLIQLAAINLSAVACLLEDYEASRRYAVETLQLAEEAGDKMVMGFAFERFLALAVADGKMEKAAVLLGIIEKIYESIGYQIEGVDKIFLEQFIIKAQTGIGEENFNRAKVQGRATALKKAVRLALEV